MFPGNRWLVLIIVSSALFLIVIDMTVLYTALPTLTHDLNAGASEKLWIMNAYMLVVAGLLPGLGTLGDRIGHRPVFLAGLVVFGLASVWAAFSPSAASLIASRVLLAIGAALMMPATLSLIRLTFTDSRERSLAIGIWAAIASGGAAIGPVVGGVLLNHFWWGSVFLVNVPIVALALVAGLVVLERRPGNPDREWDLPGSVQIMVGLVAITFAIKEIARLDPSFMAAGTALIIGAVATAAFVRRQLRSTAPMIDFALFANPLFSGGVLAAMLASACMVGVELVYSQRLQLVQGFSPLEASLRILPIPLAAFVAGPVAGIALPRIGTRLLLWLPLAVASLALIAFWLSYRLAPVWWITALACMGFAIGAAMTAASSAIMMSAPEDSAGMAASIEEVSYELGGSLGIALLGSIMTAVYARKMIIPEGAGFLPLVRDSLDQALLHAEQLAPAQAGLVLSLGRAAFDQAFAAVILTAAAVLMAAAVVQVGFILRRPPAPVLANPAKADRTPQ